MPQTAQMVKSVEKEIGASGTQVLKGVSYNTEDYNPALRQQGLMRVYDQMRNDSEVAASLDRISGPLLAASWDIEPSEDDPKGEEIADFVREVLITRSEKQSATDGTWTDFLRQAMLMLPFGFMAFEKVWGTDLKGRQVYAKFATRLPKSFYEFRFDINTGQFKEALQRVWKGSDWKEAVIPAEKLILFIHGREGDNLWGRSLLRTCYHAWAVKQGVFDVEAMRIERFGMGIPEYKVRDGADDPSAEEKAAAEKVVRELRSHERQGVYSPSSLELVIHYPTSGDSGAIELLNYCDAQIARSIGQEWVQLGDTNSGSRSLGEQKIQHAMLRLQGMGKLLEETINEQAIHDLVVRNFGARPGYPTCQVEDLDKMGGTMMAEIIAKLTPTSALRVDQPLRDLIREVMSFPPEDLATIEENIAPKMVGGEPKNLELMGGGEEQPASGEATGRGDKKQEPKAAVRMSLGAEWAPWRPLLDHERFAAFPDMARYLDLEPQRVWLRTVKPERDALIQQLVLDASTASDTALARGEFSNTDGMRNRLEGLLAEDMSRVYMRGRQSLVGEKRRQLAGLPYAASDMVFRFKAADDDEDEGDDVEPTKKQNEWVKRIAQGFVAVTIASLVSEAIRAGQSSRNAERSTERQRLDIDRALRELSEPIVMADLQGALTRTFINGRNEQAEQYRAETVLEIYSSAMDNGVCENCEAMEGETQLPGEHYFVTPNPSCFGDDRCRCITIYVFREQAA